MPTGKHVVKQAFEYKAVVPDNASDPKVKEKAGYVVLQFRDD